MARNRENREIPDLPPTGSRGERLAREFLARRGYRLAAVDYRWGRWQADILAWDGGIPVVVEVKARNRWGRPEAGLTPAQAARLVQVGNADSCANDAVKRQLTEFSPPRETRTDFFPGSW